MLKSYLIYKIHRQFVLTQKDETSLCLLSSFQYDSNYIFLIKSDLLLSGHLKILCFGASIVIFFCLQLQCMGKDLAC